VGVDRVRFGGARSGGASGLWRSELPFAKHFLKQPGLQELDPTGCNVRLQLFRCRPNHPPATSRGELRKEGLLDMFSFSSAQTARAIAAVALGLAGAVAAAPASAASGMPSTALKAVPAALTVAPVAAPAVSPVAMAQDAGDRFAEGAALYFRGRHDEALKVFQEILANNPSHEDALAYYHAAGKEVFTLMLVSGGEFESTAKRYLELATIARTEKADDAAAIDALVQKAMTGTYLDARDALYALSANHGEYGAAPFIAILGDEENQERRVQAITCLNHMAGDAVLPLIAALDSGNDRIVRNAMACLGTIGDARALPAVKRVAETTANEVNRNTANETLAKLGGAGGDSAALYLAAATRYFRNDRTVMQPYDTKDAVWAWDGEKVAAIKVPAVIRHVKLAQQCCKAAIGSAAAQAALLAAYAAEKASLAATKDMGAEGEAPEADAGLDVMLAGGGPGGCSAALGYALENDAPMAAVELLKTLESMSANTPAMTAALGSGYKAVRYAAAFALSMAGDNGAAVVGALGEALGEDALRTVLVADDQSESRNAMAAALRAAGYTVVTADSGALGFSRARTVPPKDVVIVRAGMADVTVDQFVYDSDFRASASSIILVSGPDAAEAIKAQYEGKGKVKGFATDPIASDALVETVKASLPDLNHERAAALSAAERASMILGHLPAGALGGVSTHLVAALGRSEESVLGGVLKAVGHIGSADAAATVAAIFADAARSEAIRVTAADALGGIFGKMTARPSEDVLKPVMDAATGEANLAVRLAAGRALGCAGFLTAAERAALLGGGAN
jgi:CheY-like chemotaxis protein